MSKPRKARDGRRRVVASIPEDLYIRLVSTKLQTRRSLEALMEEGILHVITKYRIARDAQRATTAPEDR